MRELYHNSGLTNERAVLPQQKWARLLQQQWETSTMVGNHYNFVPMVDNHQKPSIPMVFKPQNQWKNHWSQWLAIDLNGWPLISMVGLNHSIQWRWCHRNCETVKTWAIINSANVKAFVLLFALWLGKGSKTPITAFCRDGGTPSTAQCYISLVSGMWNIA